MSSMRKIGITLAIVFILLICTAVGANYAGFGPHYIKGAPTMLVGFSAKMMCSLHYVAGRTQENALQDMLGYSSLFGWPEVTYDDSYRRVTAEFLGYKKTAQYRTGLGCTALNNQELLPKISPINLVKSANDSAPVTALSIAFDKALKTQLDLDNAEGLDTRALLVMNARGKVLGQAYADGFSDDTLFLGWSMAKSLTAAVIGNMQYNGVLTLPAAKPLFDEWSDTEKANITLTQLLTMTSGLQFDETYQPGADATKMLFEDASASARPLASELAQKPGEFWSYSSGTANLLSLYAHELLGGDTEKTINYIAQNILVPLEMNNAVLELDSTGVFVGSSFFYATAKEWANLGVMYLNNGVFKDRRILEKQWVASATSPNGSKNDSRYGYQLWLNKGNGSQPLRWPLVPEDAFAAMGSKGQLVMVVPERDWVIVRLGWSPGRYPTNQSISRLLNAIKI